MSRERHFPPLQSHVGTTSTVLLMSGMLHPGTQMILFLLFELMSICLILFFLDPCAKSGTTDLGSWGRKEFWGA